MKMRRHGIASVALVGLLGLSMAAGLDDGSRVLAQPNIGPAAFQAQNYALLGGSVFAEGCMGSNGQQYGCMCPIVAASEFSGNFLLTPVIRVPLGHTAYDITIDEWLVTFGPDVLVISGEGYYDRWTDLYGDNWHAMTLTLLIDGEEVEFTSGALPDPLPRNGFPQEISIAVDNEATCYGYVILIEAGPQKLPRHAWISRGGQAIEPAK